MPIARRTFLTLAAGAAPLFSSLARAQAYPSRPVRLMVGFPPAGSTDITARLIGQWLSERLGQQFVIENRPGAGATLATETVAKAPADGYTLLLTGSNDAWNASLYSSLKYNFIRDILPIGSVSRGMGVLVVNPAVQARSVEELIASTKANPGKMAVATAGVGSAPFMYWGLFKSMTGADMLHVPYRGAGPALTDLIGGQVQAFFSTLIASIQHIRDGKLRALGVTGAIRSDALPDVPTIGEFVPGYEASNWFGVCAPKGMPAQIADTLHDEIEAGLANPGLKARFGELGDAVFPSSSVDFARFISEDTDKWTKVIRAANIRVARQGKSALQVAAFGPEWFAFSAASQIAMARTAQIGRSSRRGRSRGWSARCSYAVDRAEVARAE
jgi:tripartite-type tricarboxylate transporter receptor subunit TctC